MKVNGEDLGFVGSVVGVGGDHDLLIGVVVVRGIGFRGLGYGLDEILGREAEGEGCDGTGDDQNTARSRS